MIKSQGISFHYWVNQYKKLKDCLHPHAKLGYLYHQDKTPEEALAYLKNAKQ
ncbi:MAG TPA: hypothetical protein ACFCUD_09655 [Cyclobacteriaceae bacterium]